MTRAFSLVIISVLALLASCTQRMVCPAYQSAFIYDKEELRKKFSYFQNDTTPKVFTASKNKYLIAEPVSYPKKVRSLQTVAMKPVMVNVPDSISGKGQGVDSVSMEEMMKATQSVIDSTFIVDRPKKDSVAAPLDSIYVITKDRELRLLKYDAPDTAEYDPVTQRYIPQKAKYYVKDVRYNRDQDHYMWYLRKSLVLPDARLAQLQKQQGGSSEGKKEKQGLKGFFRNLFRKKEKVDSAALEANPAAEDSFEEDDFDYIEPDTAMQAEIPQPGQIQDDAPAGKKGLFGKKKKKSTKKKDNKPQPVEQPKPAEKKEDDDDGF